VARVKALLRVTRTSDANFFCFSGSLRRRFLLVVPFTFTILSDFVYVRINASESYFPAFGTRNLTQMCLNRHLLGT